MNCLMYILSWFLLQRKGVSLDNTSMFLKAKSFHCYHYSIWDWDVSLKCKYGYRITSESIRVLFSRRFIAHSWLHIQCNTKERLSGRCLIEPPFQDIERLRLRNLATIQQFHFATWSNLATRAWFKSCLFEKMFGQISSAPAIPALDVI